MAATALTFAVTGAMQRDTYRDLLDPTMYTYLKRAENIPLQGGQFFREEPVDAQISSAGDLQTKVTTWSNILGLPQKSNDTDPLHLDQPAPGYDQAITIHTYRNATRITKTLQKSDRSGNIGQMMNGLADSGRRLVEYLMANVFNTGASTAGADGSNLFANDHYHEHAAGGTYSNIETAASLTSTTFNTMRQNMRKRKGERNMVSPIKLEKIIVPADLEEDAAVVTKSDKQPETSTNRINPWKGTDYVVWDCLTNTTAWFGWGNLPEAMWGLHYAVFTQPQVDRLDYPNADYPRIAAGWELYAQIGVAGSQVKNCHRNAGA